MPKAPGQVGSHQTSKLCPLIHVWPDAGVLGSLTRVSPGTTGRRNLQPSMPPKKKFFLAAWSSGSIMTMPPSCAMASTCSTPAPAAGSAQQRHLLDRCMSFRYKARPIPGSLVLWNHHDNVLLLRLDFHLQPPRTAAGAA